VIGVPEARARLALVPVAYAVGEQGIVRYVNPSPAKVEAFLDARGTAAGRPSPLPGPPDLAEVRDRARSSGASAWRAYGDGLFLWGGEGG